MKNITRILFGFLIILISSTSWAKKGCPNPESVVPFNQIMNPAFVKKYEKCPVTTVVEYVTSGVMPGYPIAGKIKKKYIFQAIHPGASRSNGLLQGEVVGVSKEFAGPLVNLKKGQKIRIKGKTYKPWQLKWNSAMSGVDQNIYYFIASRAEVIN